MINKDDLLELINNLTKVHLSVSQLKEKLLSKNDEQLRFKNIELVEYDFERDKTLFENYIIKINRVIDDFKNYKDYNSQYVTAIKNEFDNVNNQCDQINKALLGYINYSNILNFYKRLLAMITNETKDKLYECFKYGNRDYVLFGKNGAGKTTLLKKLSTDLLNTNAVVIHATRDITYDNNSYYCSSDQELLKALSITEKGKSLFLLGQCVLKKTNEEFFSGVNPENTTIFLTEKIFNSLGVDRSLKVASNGLMYLYDDENQIKKYSIINASDGERTIIYIIAASLLAPDNAFIFIDEPENHLNGSLMRKLFDTLKKYRNDVKFIFATHNIPFIESQKNIELIYLEKSNALNNWNFKKFKDYEEVPLELLLNIEGTNDDIIFCEGEDMNSYDYKLYKILYPNYQVMPVNGCDNVMNLTRNINKFAHDLKRNAFGVIDNDFKNQEIIEDLKNNKITVLQVNEVENIFLLENSLIKIKDFMGTSETIENIKSKIIENINNKSADIKKDFCTKLFRSIQMKNKIVDVENIESNIEQLNNENKLKFLEKYKEFSKKFDDAIKREEYLELMKLVPGKFILKNVASIFELSNGNAYVNKLLDLISKDEQAMKDLIAFIGLN